MREKKRKHKGIVSITFIVVLIGFLGYICGFGLGNTNAGAIKNINLGLDLAGGVSITYQVKGCVPTSEQMSDTIYKLQKRVEEYSNEATVYQEGNNRINIEIPGVADANAILGELGKPGSLEFWDESGNVILDGTDVKDAEARTQENQGTKSVEYVVALELTQEGTEKFATATEENIGKTISIIYDNEEVNTPIVGSVVSDGNAYINGFGNYKEAEEFASIIRIGGLQLELEELRSNVVGAQLGIHAIQSSMHAGILGLIVICVFMCSIYLISGVAASIALLIYTEIVLILLNAFQITLTLPGIAGIILGIGMAVDANVIVFARIREEISDGSGTESALKNGFRKATSAIVDGNITTLLAAIVLGVQGSGSVKGFAQTLALGIAVSMFTALFITRILIYSLYAIGIREGKFYARAVKQKHLINFIAWKKVFFIISIVILLASGGKMAYDKMQGKDVFNLSLDFKGGTATTVTFEEEYSIEEIDEWILPVVETVIQDNDIQAQKVTGSSQIIIKTKTLTLEEREQLNQALEEKFLVDTDLITSENISSAISQEVRQDAFVASIVAAICMLAYIWIRFKDVSFAASAVIALLHDISIMITFYSLTKITVGNTFLACILTIVGYSINATIVIFDRIREELRKKKNNTTLEMIVNKSVTSTLTRSIYTSFTTLIMVVILYIFGVQSIKDFASPLIVGFIGGTYSSVCLTGNIWYVLKWKKGNRK